MSHSSLNSDLIVEKCALNDHISDTICQDCVVSVDVNNLNDNQNAKMSEKRMREPEYIIIDDDNTNDNTNDRMSNNNMMIEKKSKIDTPSEECKLAINTPLEVSELGKEMLQDDPSHSFKEHISKLVESITNEYSGYFDKRIITLESDINALTEENERLTRGVKDLTDEYVKHIPKKNVVYKDVLNGSMNGVSANQLNDMMTDGRYAFAFINQYIRNKWSGITRSLQVKMFTHHGVKINPSNNIGTGRKINDKESKKKINEIKTWSFVDVTAYPEIRYVFKSNKDVMELYRNRSNKGNVTFFDTIVNTIKK